MRERALPNEQIRITAKIRILGEHPKYTQKEKRGRIRRTSQNLKRKPGVSVVLNTKERDFIRE